MILLDTSVLLDLIDPGAHWRAWTREALANAIATDKLGASTVVLAECAGHFASAEEQRTYMAKAGIEIFGLQAEAAFWAGRAHRAYRRAGGMRNAILADFLIGGHALGLDATLMTRDRSRFATYFPDLTLLTPESHP